MKDKTIALKHFLVIGHNNGAWRIQYYVCRFSATIELNQNDFIWTLLSNFFQPLSHLFKFFFSIADLKSMLRIAVLYTFILGTGREDIETSGGSSPDIELLLDDPPDLSSTCMGEPDRYTNKQANNMLLTSSLSLEDQNVISKRVYVLNTPQKYKLFPWWPKQSSLSHLQS